MLTSHGIDFLCQIPAELLKLNFLNLIQGDAGTQIPEKMMTAAKGHLDGKHPTTIRETVDMQI